MIIKNCDTIEEYNSGLSLINYVFRINDGFEPTMQNEFPYLLSSDNKQNMFIAKENDKNSPFFNKAISVATYLQNPILIEGTEINSASIGAVCTYEEYIKQGLSSKVLDELEKNMKENDIDISLVSGTRTLYTRRNYIEANSMIQLNIKIEDLDLENLNLKIKEYDENILDELISLYNQNSTRYRRTYEEFKKIIISRPHPWGQLDYITKLTLFDDTISSYIIIQTIDKKDGIIIEASGNPNHFIPLAKKIAFEMNLNSLTYNLNSCILPFLKTDSTKTKNISNGGTMKIINYLSFMKKLSPYFCERSIYGKKVIFKEKDDNFYLIIEDEELKINGIDNISKLVFGKMDDIFYSNISEKNKISHFIKNCFPIPIPYTENLNYQ